MTENKKYNNSVSILMVIFAFYFMTLPSSALDVPDGWTPAEATLTVTDNLATTEKEIIVESQEWKVIFSLFYNGGIYRLFDKVYDRRVLVRLIGVRFSHLIGGSYQIKLFEDSFKLIKLYQAMDKVRDRYGQQAVKRAIGMGSKTIGHMNPFNGQAPVIPAHRRL